jgi:hypothetical protein
MTDLWPDEFGKSDVTPPRAILREQAELLGKKTQGRLEGLVKTTAATRDSFAQHFYLSVPVLEDYRYRLLVVVHPVQFYPLDVEADVLSKTFQCATEKDFKEALREIFNSDETKRIITALVAQVEEVEAAP